LFKVVTFFFNDFTVAKVHFFCQPPKRAAAFAKKNNGRKWPKHSALGFPTAARAQKSLADLYHRHIQSVKKSAARVAHRAHRVQRASSMARFFTTYGA